MRNLNKSFIVPDADIVAGNAEGTPGDVKPAGASQELVGILTCLQKRDEALELGRIAGTDVGGLADEVLGVLDAADQAVDAAVAVAGIDDDGAYLLTGGFQEHQAAIG